MGHFWKVAYVSEIAAPEQSVLDEIVSVSETNNKSDGLSGILLWDRRSFLQILEGPRPRLADCMLRISADPRHSRIRMLASAPSETLFFSHWSLGAATLPDNKRSLSAFADLLDEQPLSQRIELIERLCIQATQTRP